MAHQYFEDNTMLSHQCQEWETVVNETGYRFKTDSGVFSRQRLDFGTRVLLETVIQAEFHPKKILDLGCGYGPVGTVMGTEYPEATLHMVDVSERAMELARYNVSANQVAHAKIYSSNIYQEVKVRDFDLILTNPPIRAGKEVVHTFISGAYLHLAMGGRLVLVIQKKQGAPSARKKLLEVFGNVEELERKKGYWILCAQKNES